MKTSEEATTTCAFCRIVRRESAPDVLAYCDDNIAVFPSLHQQPRNRGHMLVVPTKHVAQIYSIDGDLAGPLMTTVARVAAAVKAAFGADGVSIRQNNEPAGGQDVLHIHFHVIPRFANDGFNSGQDRFPCGATEVPIDERVEQAKRLSKALGLRDTTESDLRE